MATPTYRISGSQVSRENVPEEWLARARPELGVRVEHRDWPASLQALMALNRERVEQARLAAAPPSTPDEGVPEENLQALATYRTVNNKVLFGQNLCWVAGKHVKTGDAVILKREKGNLVSV